MEKLKLARAFANMVHAKHTYDGVPYQDQHLDDVELILSEAGMGSEDDRIVAQLHDTIEDVDELLRKMAQDFIFTNFGFSIYSVVWAMSGIGHNRKARNGNYYEKIGRYPRAANYKVGDRISNWENAVRTRNISKATMYAKEHDTFVEKIVSLATNQKLIDRYMAIKPAFDAMMADVRASAAAA